MFDFIRKMSKNHRAILFTCFYAFVVNGTLSMLMGSVLPDLKATYQLNDTVSGLFISAHSAGNLIAGFISGLVPLWLGRKRSIMTLSVAAFIGYAMMLAFGNPVWLFIAFLCVGIGRGAVTNFDSRMTNLLSNGSAAATNLLHSCFAVGAITMPLIFLVLRGWIGWQAGILFVVALGVIEQILWSRMKLEDDHPQRSDKQNSTMVFLKNPSFLILALMMFCYLCSEYAINGWLVTYIQSKESLQQALVSAGTTLSAYSQTMATLLWTVMLIGRLLCAWLSSKVSQKILMMVSSFGMVVFFILMLNGNSIASVTATVAGLGFCMAGICPMIYSDAAIFTNTYPMATSALLAIGSIGAIAMPTIVGSLADRFGFDGGMRAIMVTIILLAVFATLNVVVKTRKPNLTK